MKKNAGFTIIEVLIAMGILVGAVYTLSDLQIRSLFRIIKDREKIANIFLVKREIYRTYLYPPRDDKGIKPRTITLEKPALTIATEPVQISKKSSFKSMHELVFLVKTHGKWVRGDSKRAIDIFTIVPKPKKKEEEKR
jgi:prepilin-type N-terminal cleavage/methylation domain-containing protein